MEEHDPNSGNRVSEVECLRERIKMLEKENDDLRIRSAFMKQRLDELEAALRSADPTCAEVPDSVEFPNPDDEDDDSQLG